MASSTRPTAGRSPSVLAILVRPLSALILHPRSMLTDSVDIGANASAEEPGDEGADDTATQVLDIVHSFRLNETGFDKKGYLTYLKGEPDADTDATQNVLTPRRLHEGGKGQAHGAGQECR
jgi:hypothetical protein